MQSITININNNDELAGKVIGMLNELKSDDLEIVLTEDIGDLKRLKATRNEESISFNQYIKNEN
jgi:hypothetical protein